MNRGFSKILILVILVVLAGGGIFAWQYLGQDETADWQTYRNEKYNVEFQYPNLWILDSSEALSVTLPDQSPNFIQINISNGVEGPEDESMSRCQPGITAIVFQISKLREDEQTFEEFVNFQIENPERGLPPAVKPELISTTISGHDALKTKGTVDNCKTEFYYVERGSERYMTISVIVDKDDDRLVIDKILSTFKFLE